MISSRIILNLFACCSVVAIGLMLIFTPEYAHSRAVAVSVDTLYPPEISFVPRTVTLNADTSGFVMTNIKVLNRGGSPLILGHITPSCGCAAATVMKNPVNPMDVGGISIRINTTNITDTVARVEFSIESNATPSPVVYVVTVRNTHGLR